MGGVMSGVCRFWWILSGALGACEAPKAEDFVDDGGTLHGEQNTSDSGAEETDDTGGQPPSLDPLQVACETGEAGDVAALASVVLSSEIQWTLNFDEEAEALGLEDCTYTRTYEGVQRFDWEHLCPSCEFITRGTATMVDGLSCYRQIASEGAAERTEMWAIDGEGALRRSGRDQFPLTSALATLDELSGEGQSVAVGWQSTDNALSDGGTFALEAAGQLRWLTDPEVTQPDPWGPRAAAYACGWECNDPENLIGAAPLMTGQTVPNGRFTDQCGERVDLWDFWGSYVVLDSSQSDCGPCRSMASTHEEFVQRMRRLGVPVRVLTLMGNGLAASWETPPAETVADWVQAYEISEPVLADNGWAFAHFPEFIEGFRGDDYGYPAWLVLDPQLRPIHGQVGFSSWDAVSDVIIADSSEDSAAR